MLAGRGRRNKTGRTRKEAQPPIGRFRDGGGFVLASVENAGAFFGFAEPASDGVPVTEG